MLPTTDHPLRVRGAGEIVDFDQESLLPKLNRGLRGSIVVAFARVDPKGVHAIRTNEVNAVPRTVRLRRGLHAVDPSQVDETRHFGWVTALLLLPPEDQAPCPQFEAEKLAVVGAGLVLSSFRRIRDVGVELTRPLHVRVH